MKSGPFFFTQKGYIGVGDGCWRQNMVVTDFLPQDVGS